MVHCWAGHWEKHWEKHLGWRWAEHWEKHLAGHLVMCLGHLLDRQLVVCWEPYWADHWVMHSEWCWVGCWGKHYQWAGCLVPWTGRQIAMEVCLVKHLVGHWVQR